MTSAISCAPSAIVSKEGYSYQSSAMPASESLRDGTVDDNFESCDEGEGEASGNELHAGQTHGLESIAAARPKSQRVASQAAAKRRQHPSTPGAPEGPAGPAEAYTKLQLEEKLAAVQFLFTRELDKVVKLCQEKHDQLQQELQQERARWWASLADRVAALEAASQQLPQPQEDLRAQVEAFKVDTKHVQEDLRRQLEANEVRDRAPCLMMFGLQEQHAADGQALHGAVTQELVQSAGPHGFTSSSVASAVRLGRPNLTGPGRGLSSSGAPLWVASIRHFAAVRISGHVRVSPLMSISPQPK